MLSDLGVARAVWSAAWFPGKLMKPRSATARSVSLLAPPFASWKCPPPPFPPFHVRRLFLHFALVKRGASRPPLLRHHHHTP